MDKLQKQVREMHREILNQPCSPAEPALRCVDLRARLIAEEAIETVYALVGCARGQTVIMEQMISVLQERTRAGKTEPDLLEAIDGCADTLVVTYGTLEALGVDGEPFTDEVMRSNMAKKGGPVDAGGKALKPPGWAPPDIAGVLAHIDHGRGDEDSGPFDPDCPCRGGDAQELCARSGCGFCRCAPTAAVHP